MRKARARSTRDLALAGAQSGRLPEPRDGASVGLQPCTSLASAPLGRPIDKKNKKTSPSPFSRAPVAAALTATPMRWRCRPCATGGWDGARRTGPSGAPTVRWANGEAAQLSLLSEYSPSTLREFFEHSWSILGVFSVSSLFFYQGWKHLEKKFLLAGPQQHSPYEVS